MIKHILLLLKETPIGKSETIDIAKGKYKLPTNFKEFKNQVRWQSQKQ